MWGGYIFNIPIFLSNKQQEPHPPARLLRTAAVRRVFQHRESITKRISRLPCPKARVFVRFILYFDCPPGNVLAATTYSAAVCTFPQCCCPPTRRPGKDGSAASPARPLYTNGAFFGSSNVDSNPPS